MISVNNLSIHFTGTDLFSNASFLVNDRDRIGLVGKNGSGKTTLMNIIAGNLIPQEGVVVIPSNTTIGFLRQEMETLSQRTIFDEALTAFAETLKLEEKIHHLTKEISSRTDYESKDYHRLIHQLTEANERFHMVGGQSIEGETEKVLIGLGFKRSDFKRPMAEFSSGWQMRVELAKILLRRPDVILLDEPTNHLDIESIQWLEDYLINYFGAIVLVSHDRAFLDNVTKRTIEISLGQIYDYRAGYSDYVKMREERLELQVSAYNNQQKQINQIERFIERFRYKSSKAKQVQSRVKMLEKIDEISFDEIDKSAIHFRFPPAPHSGKVVIEATGLGKNYGDFQVLKNLNFDIINGDSVAFVGRNGEGKTTLSRILVGELEYSGSFKFGHNVKIGYFAQNQGEYLDPEKTVFETIDDIAVGDIRKQIRAILGSFLFSGETIDKKVKVLSGGEKSRLSLAKLLLTPSNLLILDEPTNHLDMQSKDILKNALIQFDGTLIIVSHDRDFLQGLTNKVFEFRDQKIKEHLGDIYDFLEYRKVENLKQLEIARKNEKIKDSSVSDNKANWEKKKSFEKEQRKLNSQISKSEEKIGKIEIELTKLNELLSNPKSYTTETNYFDLSKQYDNLKQELEKEMKLWEELHQKIELLNQE
jgi:ATP-binding cassette, subfamily F, member 3